MTLHPRCLVRPLWARLLLGAAVVAFPALAVGQNEPSNSQASYQNDLAACKLAPTGTDKVACRREAAAVRAGGVSVTGQGDPGRFARNAIKRCEPLAEPDRSDCVARVQGEGTASGSVAGGGIYRELVTREGATQTLPAAAGKAASAAQ
jgi:hypothetical protein